MAVKTITVKGDPVVEEFKTNGAITPGMLCELSSTAGDAQVHDTAGGTAAAFFALEDEWQGKEISEAYADNQQAQFGMFRAGDIVNALLANGESCAIGDYGESNGDGYLRVVDADASVGDVGVRSAIGRFRAALDMSDSSGADPASARVKFEII